MSDLPANYQSYLLRFWRPDSETAWRIQIESVCSGHRQSFCELPGLVRFLHTQLLPEAGDEPGQDPAPEASEPSGNGPL